MSYIISQENIFYSLVIHVYSICGHINAVGFLYISTCGTKKIHVTGIENIVGWCIETILLTLRFAFLSSTAAKTFTPGDRQAWH